MVLTARWTRRVEGVDGDEGNGGGTVTSAHPRRPPQRAIVVGAGIVGLSCAWALQEEGVEVCVVERRSPGSGASWQNAGYVSPALCVPLPEPSILRYGLRAVLTPSSPVSLLSVTDARLLRFMAHMVRHCRAAEWRRSMAVYRQLNEQVDASFERQRQGGVDTALSATDVMACFAHSEESAAFRHEIDGVVGSGQSVDAEVLTGDEAREIEPHLSSRISMAVRVRAQHYLTPSAYVDALAQCVRARGGKILEDHEISGVERRGDGVVAIGSDGDMEADAIVLATGAWISRLARPHGVRLPVYGGRGYSFTASCGAPLAGTLYFPAARIAVTPQGDRARFAGIMEFGSPDAAARRGRFATMVRDVSPLIDGVDLAGRSDEWVGPRPLSADGLPLVGETATSGVFVAGGHGMWGVTLGPLTGQLLARRIVTGESPAPLAALDPCRGAPARTRRQ